MALVMALTSSANAAGAGKRYEVRFPASFVTTAEDLAIDHVNFVVACGEIVAVEHVPSDWNIGVSRPISGQVGFDASAGHGASALKNLSELDGVIVVSSLDKRCFGFSMATASSMRGEWERNIDGMRLVERPSSR
ncbi:hypothetical protein [Lysobacter brunescens]|uniref:Uncharacterized protein n=1 Tax=Lysobacter brunescens TaxID=262323 RepID=A0ABW2YED0_9GAMM